MAKRSEVELGTTVLGRVVSALWFLPPDYARERPPVILFGAIHGDEPLGIHCLNQLAIELIDRPPGRETWLIPVLNLDGVNAGTKNNANDVDLNRNWAAANWVAEFQPGYNPGAAPESEPESQMLSQLIDRTGARRLIALHSPYRTVNYDGSGQDIAEAMAEQNGYGASADIGYPTPGSFGSKYGGDLGLEVVTLEIPLMSENQAWAENRNALRVAVDLPPM